MERLWIFCLSCGIFFHCKNKPPDWLNDVQQRPMEERREFAKQYQDSLMGYYLGSEWSQRTFDTLIMIHPQGEEYYREQSIPFTKRGDFDIAIPLLERSLSLDSAECLYYYSWLRLYHYRDYHRALELLQAYDDMTPGVRDYAWSTNVNFMKGQAYQQLGNHELAIAEMDTVIRDEKESVDSYVWVYKGISQLALDSLGAASESFGKALTIFPENTMAMYYRAQTLKRQGRDQEALSWMKRAAKNILKGNKLDHPYYEVFHEIYPEMIADQLKSWGYEGDMYEEVVSW